MKQLITGILFFLSCGLFAQSVSPQVINSAGGSATVGGNNWQYSIGEAIIGGGPNATTPQVTQGFNQPLSSCLTPLVVTSTADDNTCGTLRFAVNTASFNGIDNDIITFDPSLDGQVIELDSSLTFRNDPFITVDASGLDINIHSSASFSSASGSHFFYAETPIHLIGLKLQGTVASLLLENGIVLRPAAGQSVIDLCHVSGFKGFGINVETDSTLITNNVIYANTAIGLLINGRHNEASGNYVGLQPNGTSAGGGHRTYGGLVIAGDSNYVHGNYVSGNDSVGIRIVGAENGIEGNFVGLNTAGAAVGNGGDGIAVDTFDVSQRASWSYLIGNYIGGNTGYGVNISGAEVTSLTGNFIGLNASNQSRPNASGGVRIYRAKFNFVGLPGKPVNTIANNGGLGIHIQFSDTNFVFNNIIRQNAGSGVVLSNGSKRNVIGAGNDGSGESGNIITQNTGRGILISGSGTNFNRVMANYIGTDASSADLGNTMTGIRLEAGASSNVIGDGSALSDSSNIVAFNDLMGVEVDGATTIQNSIAYNYIGTNADTLDLGNSGSGISVSQAINNIIVANAIAFNQAGIAYSANANANRHLENAIFSNTTSSINFNGTVQNNVVAPGITSYDATTFVVSGTNTSGTTGVQVFADQGAQGRIFLGDATVSGTSWSYTLTAQNQSDISNYGLDSLTAIQTVTVGVNSNSSPFSVAYPLQACDPLVVTSTADDNTCGTLRYAINWANANDVNPLIRDVITFNIPGAGSFTIGLSSQLPSITDSVIIAGRSQLGFLDNIDSLSLATRQLMIELDGGNAVDYGLRILSSNVTIRGLSIGGFREAGVSAEGVSGFELEGSFIGVKPDGTTNPNTIGVRVLNLGTSKRSYIGGGHRRDINLISANTSHGVLVDNSPEFAIVRNFIGVNRTGTTATPNMGLGIYVRNSDDVLIGTNAAGFFNVIAGNNGGQLFLEGSNNTIIKNNNIGAGSGAVAISSSANVITIESSDSATIGDSLPQFFNRIANASGAGNGIFFSSGSTGNFVQGNSIYNNGGFGISFEGATEQDNMKAPAVTNIVDNAGTVTISGTVSESNAVIQVYADANDEGRVYLGTVNASGGVWSFPMTAAIITQMNTVLGAGTKYITATATNSNNSTSPFSVLVEYVVCTPPVITASGINPTCFGESDGALVVKGLTDDVDYTLTYNGGTVSLVLTAVVDSIVSTGLPSGDYTDVFVTLNGCSSNVVSIVTLTEPDPLVVTTSDYTVCALEPTTYTVVGSGGTTPYSYDWVLESSNPSTGIPEVVETPVANHTVGVRIVDINGCSEINSFEVSVVAPPDIEFIADVVACDSYTLPAVPDGAGGGLVDPAYYTETGGVGTRINAGAFITASMTLYAYDRLAIDPFCSYEREFDITINTTPTADAPSDVTDCDSYTLPVLSVGNYYTASNGGGTLLNAGDAITTTQTLYVYAETGTTPNCTEENSFDVTITPSPSITATSINPTTAGANDGSITISGLNPGVEYRLEYYDINASNSAGDYFADASGEIIIPNLVAGTYTNIFVVLSGCSSNVITSVVLTDPLTLLPAPSITCVQAANQQATITWADMSVSAYTILYTTDTTTTPLTTTSTTNSTTLSGLVNGQTYYVAVTYAGADTSAWHPVNPVDRAGQAIEFDATTQNYIEIPQGTLSAATLGNGARTIEAWVKPVAGEELTVLQMGGTGANEKFLVRISGTGDVILDLQGASTQWNTAIPMDNQWHHIALVYAGNLNNSYLMVDEGASMPSTTPNAQANLADGPIWIGRGNYSSTDHYSTGQIDELRIWNDGRTTQEVLDNLYQPLKGDGGDGLLAVFHFDELQGDTAYNSVCGAEHGVWMNNPVSVVSGAMQEPVVLAAEALDFDGIDDKVTIPNNSPAWNLESNFTVEMWIYPRSLNDQILAYTNGCDFSCAAWTLYIGSQLTCDGSFTGVANKIGFSAVQGVNINLVSDQAPTLNTWSHVSVTYDGVDFKMYINGELQTVQVHRPGITIPTSVQRYIGMEDLSGLCGSRGPYNGKIDEFRIWNRALCEAEIQANMNADVLTNKTGLTAQYSFNQGVAGANNSTIDYLVDSVDASGDSDGTLYGFDLNSSSSNWVAPGAITSGTVATTVVCPAKAPSTVCAHPINGEVLLSWDAVTEAALGYTVIWGTDSTSALLGSQNEIGTSATISGLTNNTLYYFAVVSVGGDTSNWAAAVPVVEAGKAVSFDGIYQAIIDPVIQAKANYTISAWIKLDSAGNGIDRHIYSEGNPSALYALYVTADNHLELGVYNSGPWVRAKSSILLPFNEWIFVAASFNAGSVELIVNDFTETLPSLVAIVIPPMASIGILNQGGTNTFHMEIDELAIWDATLSYSTLQQFKDKPLLGNETGLVGLWHFDEPTGTDIAYDATCNGNHGIWQGSPTVVESGAMHPFGGVVTATGSVDGTSAEVSWTNNLATDVAEFWIYELQSTLADTTGATKTVVSNSAVTSYEFTAYTGCDTIWYAVYAVDEAGQVGLAYERDSAIVCEPCNPLLVTKTSDDGSCGTLRGAIEQAMLNAGPDTIRFANAMIGQTITLVDVLPGIVGSNGVGTYIDGLVNADTIPDINIDGSGIVDFIQNVYAFNVSANDVTIEGLAIYNVPVDTTEDLYGYFGDGINIGGGTNTVIRHNYFGTNTNLDLDLGNAGPGITVYGIGTEALITSNVFIGNGKAEKNITQININTNDGATITNNLIGVLPTMTMNNSGGYGIMLFESNDIVVQSNIIGGVENGIQMITALTSSIENNFIGTNTSGALLSNSGTGIYLNFSDENMIVNNVIANNAINGIHMTNISNKNKLLENSIGYVPSLGTVVGVQGVGVLVDDGSEQNEIGEGVTGSSNIIAGNTTAGIVIDGTTTFNTYVYHNYIGTNASFDDLGNGGPGIILRNNANTNTIGKYDVANDSYANYIAFNGGSGVLVKDITVAGNYNRIDYNYIGTDAKLLSQDFGNAGQGILVDNSFDQVMQNNIIAFNSAGIKYINGAARNSHELTNVIHSNGGMGIVFEDTLVQNKIPKPIITSFNSNTGVVTIEASDASIDVITLYADFNTEGFLPLGTATRTGATTFNYTLTTADSANIILYGLDSLTAIQGSGTAYGNSSFQSASEFSEPFPILIQTPCNLTVNLGADIAQVCGADTLLQTNKTGIANITYRWFLADTTTAELATTNTYAVTASGEYIVVIDSAGCIALDTITIGNVYAFDATIAYSNLDIALGSVSLSTSSQASIAWSEVGGGIYFTQNSNATIDLIVVYSTGRYYFTKTDNQNCFIVSDTVEVIDSSIPCNLTVDLGADIIQVCGADTLLQTNKTGVANINYRWFNGDTNTTVLATTESYTATVGGDYIVVIDSAACIAIDTISVGNFSNIVVDLGNDTVSCLPQVTLDASSSTTGVTYTWSTGANTPSIDVTTSGDYSVLLQSGSCAVSDTVNVSFTKFVVDLGVDVVVCGTDTVLDAGVSGANVTYSWTALNTQSFIPVTTQTVMVNTSDTYTVVVDSAGCIASDAIQVTVIDLAIDDAITGSSCLNSITFDASTMTRNAQSYTWYNSQNVSVSNTSDVTIDVSGDYTLVVSNQSCSLSEIVPVQVGGITINLPDDIDTCLTEVTLDAGVFSNATYTWTALSGQISGASNGQTALATQSGTYRVAVTLAGGCSDVDTVAVQLNGFELSQVSVTNETATGAADGVIDVAISPVVVISSYNYQNLTTLVSGSSLTEPISGLVAADYQVIAISDQGCSDTLDVVTVGVGLSSLNPGSIASNQTICSGGILNPLTSITDASTTGTGIITYSWISSTDGATWAAEAGTGTGFTPVALTVSTYFRRIATDGINTDTTASVLITVTTAQINKALSVTTTNNSVCNGDNATINITSSESGIIYQALLAGNPIGTSVGGTGNTISIIIASTDLVLGLNTINVEASSTGECATTALLDNSVEVTVQSSAGPVITPASATLCTGGSTELTVPTGATSYQWYIDGNRVVGEKANTITAYIEGAYTVEVQSGDGCDGASSPVNVVYSTAAYNPSFSVVGGILQADQAGANYQWYVDYKGRRLAIVGATAATYTPVYTGTYYLSVNVAGDFCTRMSSGVSANGSSGQSIATARLATTESSIYITAEEVSVALFVHPNPVLDDFTIVYTSSNYGTLYLSLLDMNGVELWHSTHAKSSFSTTIQVSELAEELSGGVYLLKVVDGNEVQLQKIMME